MRNHSVPERLGIVGLGVAVAAAGYPALHRVTGFAAPCPLRTLTGIPCPLCGMTTAATGLATGDLSGALRANPFIVGLVALTLAGLSVLAVRAFGFAEPPTGWSVKARRRTASAVGVLTAASWMYQLRRFGYL
jgi:hypothetical protein